MATQANTSRRKLAVKQPVETLAGAPKRAERKDVGSMMANWGMIAICFLLGVADMIMLREAMVSAFHMDYGGASFLALMVATVANATALMWGMETGKHLQKKSVNKYSRASFVIWVMIGLAYMAMRLLALSQKIDEAALNDEVMFGTADILGEVVQMFILAAFYVGTGLTISTKAAEIFDQDVVRYNKAKKEFDKAHDMLAEDSADLQELVGKLKGYDRHYDSLDLQRDKLKSAIQKSERQVMSDILGKTLEQNEIDPEKAHQVMEEILSRR